jgi:hypothetical protein
MLAHDYGLGMLLLAATEPELVGRDGAICGVGPVEAAAATARILLERRPSAVLHVGLAGKHGFREPEVILAGEERYCDTDSPLVHATSFPDPKLLAAARAALPGVLVCPIGTSARVGGTTNCTIEAMEGFGVLRACELAGVPALELRVTANEISEPDRSRWRIAAALELLEATVTPLQEALGA